MDDQVKDKLIELLSDMRDLLTKTSTGLKGVNKEIKSNEDVLKDLEKQLMRARTGIKNLSEDFRDGAIDVADAFKQMQGFNRALIRSSSAIDKETAARFREIESAYKRDVALNFFGSALESAAKNLIDFNIAAGKTMIQDLQGTGNAFNMVTKITHHQIDATRNFVDSIGSATQTAGVAMAFIPGWMRYVGVALTFVGEAIKGLGSRTADLTKFGVEVLNNEVQKTITVFTNNSKAGIFFGNGMSALTQQLHGAGLSYRDFFGALQGASQQLTMIGGSAGRGAEQVAKTFKAMEPFRRGLLNLGLTVEDQVQGTAQYMAILAQSGKLQGKNDADLAKGTEAYLTNLKAITSITGEEAKSAQARAQKASEQLAVQTTLSKLDGEARIKFNNAIKLLPASATSAIQQLLTLGTVTGETATAYAQVPNIMRALTQYAADIKDASVDPEDAMKRLGEVLGDPNTQKQLQAIGEPFGNAALAVGKLTSESQALADMFQFVMKLEKTSIAESIARTKDQKNTTDELTNKVSEATEQFQKLQQNLEKDLRPAIVEFSKFVAEQIITQRAIIEKAMRLLLGGGGSDKPSADSRFGTTQGPAGDPFGAVTGRVLPRKALGGIVTSPSIAGEAGPEAVVPLPDGRTIPTNIDLSPLVNTMNLQVQLTSDLLDEIKNSNYIQEKILVASQ